MEEALDAERKSQAYRILNVLAGKGFKKIGKRTIKELQKSDDLKDHYDEVIEFYQSVLTKERERIEEDKKKKLREVELWTRAIREEEKIVVEQYAVSGAKDEVERMRELQREAWAR